MKLKTLLLFLCYWLPTLVLAQWKMVGKADYTWGPFHVYSISLYTETGEYYQGIRPLMLSILFNKPVEGKSFAITLMKEINSLKIEGIDKNKVLEDLQSIFPDLQPKDSLSYIAMDNYGYFVLNDTVLNHEFDSTFNHAFIAVWLADNSNFLRLQKGLLGNQSQNASSTNAPDAEITSPIEPTTIETEKAQPAD